VEYPRWHRQTALTCVKTNKGCLSRDLVRPSQCIPCICSLGLDNWTQRQRTLPPGGRVDRFVRQLSRLRPPLSQTHAVGPSQLRVARADLHHPAIRFAGPGSPVYPRRRLWSRSSTGIGDCVLRAQAEEMTSCGRALEVDASHQNEQIRVTMASQ
jgi:hypothetical protein